MDFELLDGYLLDAKPVKADVVKRLLAERSPLPAAQAFYEGMRMLGARTPDCAWCWRAKRRTTRASSRFAIWRNGRAPAAMHRPAMPI
jgi:hypothetical protein